MAKPDQRTDDDNSKASDPNMTGSGNNKSVSDKTAGLLTKSCQYGDLDTYQNGALFSRNG